MHLTINLAEAERPHLLAIRAMINSLLGDPNMQLGTVSIKLDAAEAVAELQTFAQALRDEPTPQADTFDAEEAFARPAVAPVIAPPPVSQIDPAVAYAALGGALPTPPAVEVDDKGTPYDPALHAKNKAKNADGTWRAARRSPDAAPVVAQAPAPAAPAPAPVVTPPPAEDDFASMMQAVQAACDAKRWTGAEAVAAAQSLGVANIVALMQRPDLMAQFRLLIP